MTIFTTTSYSVGALIADIDLGKVGIPGLQRPFVWANVKVRKRGIRRGSCCSGTLGRVTSAGMPYKYTHHGAKENLSHRNYI